MKETYYTVEQVSKMLSSHPKTIQRYIREGKIRASKIGKSWRISGHDLSVFTENSKNIFADEAPFSATRQEINTTASSVIEMSGYERDNAISIINTLNAALNTKPVQYGQSAMHTQYIETEQKIRITLWGDIAFMTDMFSFLCAFTEKLVEDENL
ncbi:MAG: helix-turn-helix domain-containing protein [Eubacteriaceae bacterium]|nr:helix-turn-helix domain-containing protein [Eubacteriaceae bacterium]